MTSADLDFVPSLRFCLAAVGLTLQGLAISVLMRTALRFIKKRAPEVLALALICRCSSIAARALVRFDPKSNRRWGDRCECGDLECEHDIFEIPWRLVWRLVKRMSFAVVVKLARCQTSARRPYDYRYNLWSDVAWELKQVSAGSTLNAVSACC